MREPLEIITNIRNFIQSTNPFKFPYLESSVLDLLNELENTLTPQSIEEPVVEETPVIEEVVAEELVVEEVVEETFTEEPTVEVVAPKKRPRKV